MKSRQAKKLDGWLQVSPDNLPECLQSA